MNKHLILVALLAASMALNGYAGPGAAYESESQWSGHARSAYYVTMRDGVRIAVDVLLPTGYTAEGDAAEKFPVIFEYTPYHRAFLNLETGEVDTSPLRTFFLQQGYAYVSADFRGTGASFGWMNHMSEPIREDGREVVDWIAAQPWSDGNVGMWGGSYVGWSQMATASKRPKALKAIIPVHIGWDRFIGNPGGIYDYAFLETWSAMAYSIHRNRVFGDFPMPPAPPVIDEDGDGELADEIPIDADGNGWFYDDYAWPVEPNAPPQYADGVQRDQHNFFNAIMEHVQHPGGAPGSYDITPVIQSQWFWDTPRVGDGDKAADANFGFLPDVADSGVAIYNYAGWWDAFLRSSLQIYATLKDRNPSRVAVWPMYHQGLSPAAAETLGIGPENFLYSASYLGEQLRWYDRWLKGIDNGIDKEPPVQIYVVNGEGWRAENEWPLAREQRTRMFLTQDGVLGVNEPAGSGSDDYTADFTQNSGWGPKLDTAGIATVNALRPKAAPTTATFYRSRQQMMGLPETAPYRTEQDRQSLTYSSAPLEEDTEVTGHPVVRVWASSTADYGDLFFYLEDVDEDGNAILVTEHGHRAGFDRLVDDDELIPNNPGIDVKPDLPWHGYKQSDYTDRVFADGAIVEVVTDLMPASWLFKKGHRIRLSIAAADWPTFQLHPKLAPANDPHAPDTITPTLTIHRGAKYQSHIELPVIPKP